MTCDLCGRFIWPWQKRWPNKGLTVHHTCYQKFAHDYYENLGGLK